GASGAHRHTGVRRGQSGSVIDAVAYHDGYSQLLLGLHHLNFLRRRSLGENLVDPQNAAYQFSHVRVIASEEGDSIEAGPSKRSQGQRRVAPDRVFENQSATEFAFDGDKDSGGPFQHETALQSTEPRRRRLAL